MAHVIFSFNFSLIKINKKELWIFPNVVHTLSLHTRSVAHRTARQAAGWTQDVRAVRARLVEAGTRDMRESRACRRRMAPRADPRTHEIARETSQITRMTKVSAHASQPNTSHTETRTTVKDKKGKKDKKVGISLERSTPSSHYRVEK